MGTPGQRWKQVGEMACLLLLMGTTLVGTACITLPLARPTAPASLPPATGSPLATTTIRGEDGIMCVSGYVISGGDTTPQSLLDAPRRFVYQIQTEEEGVINVAYTAFPPSPVNRPKPRLDFHAGTIVIGDYLRACGQYTADENLVVVSRPDEFIETAPSPDTIRDGDQN